MSGNYRCLRAFALALVFATLPFTDAFAHCFVGARFLPATLATDDPCVADEMSLPTISWSRTADMPPAKIIGAPLSARQSIAPPQNIVLSGDLETKDHRSRAPPPAA